MFDFITDIDLDSIFGEGWQDSLAQTFSLDLDSPATSNTDLAPTQIPEAPQTFSAGDAVDMGADVELPPELKQQVVEVMRTQGREGFMEFFKGLDQPTQRALMSAGAMGARSLLSGVQQRNAQEFTTEQSQQQRDFARGQEDRARAERESLHAEAPRAVQYKPRGLIRGAVGG